MRIQPIKITGQSRMQVQTIYIYCLEIEELFQELLAERLEMDQRVLLVAQLELIWELRIKLERKLIRYQNRYSYGLLYAQGLILLQKRDLFDLNIYKDVIINKLLEEMTSLA